MVAPLQRLAGKRRLPSAGVDVVEVAPGDAIARREPVKAVAAIDLQHVLE